MIIALALLVAQTPELPVDGRVHVAILSKHAPKRVDLVAGHCRADGELVTSLRVDGARVKACAGKRCRSRARLSIQCEAPATLRVHALAPRVYGRRFEVQSREGALRVIAELDLERYVRGVVAAELADAPIEAKRAQAILARGFALRAEKDVRHSDVPLCDLTHCQVFAGVPTSTVVALGEPLVLVEPGGGVADVFFHSTCGGRTASPRRVWGDRGSPDVVGVEDVDASGRAWCRKSPHYRWVHELTDDALVAALSRVLSRPYEAGSFEIEPLGLDATRWQVGDREGAEPIRGEVLHLELARKLGFSAVKSSLFSAERAGGSFRLSGHGLGHRVGMCQSGAIARARAGHTAAEILAAYFPKLTLAKAVPQ